MKHHPGTLKDAMMLAPINQCPYTGISIHSTSLKSLWRMGWAAGFIDRPKADYLANISATTARIAFGHGYDRGQKDLHAFEACGTTA